MMACSLTCCPWAGRTPNLGWPTGVPILGLSAWLDFLTTMAAYMQVQGSKCKCFSEQGGSCLRNHVVPVPSLPPLLLVTSESHTYSHSRGVDIGTICQLEESQGRTVKARVCELEGCSYFWKCCLSQCLWCGVHINYPVERLFLATVCLAYLPLCIWELFRRKKNLYLWSKKKWNSNNSDENNKC